MRWAKKFRNVVTSMPFLEPRGGYEDLVLTKFARHGNGGRFLDGRICVDFGLQLDGWHVFN